MCSLRVCTWSRGPSAHEFAYRWSIGPPVCSRAHTCSFRASVCEFVCKWSIGPLAHSRVCTCSFGASTHEFAHTWSRGPSVCSQHVQLVLKDQLHVHLARIHLLLQSKCMLALVRTQEVLKDLLCAHFNTDYFTQSNLCRCEHVVRRTTCEPK